MIACDSLTSQDGQAQQWQPGKLKFRIRLYVAPFPPSTSRAQSLAAPVGRDEEPPRCCPQDNSSFPSSTMRRVTDSREISALRLSEALEGCQRSLCRRHVPTRQETFGSRRVAGCRTILIR